MNLGMMVAFYGVFFVASGGLHLAKQSKKEFALFVLFIGMCMYMSLARSMKLPVISIIDVDRFVFEPMGRWLYSFM
ncbi:hypothetical protein [Paenibacillus soyae]|uniref:Uncharacterized protein n=1 Tax=Paenibacillus soyae TaxID=2969249 RepID=A0A9X2S9P1_9BACL|nr:hypothetical protein [Paenibacillus soyae]MCR2805669.1 hypothetical protein [Paenibacillus soyae]